MSQFNLDSLIQFSELSKTFSWTISQINSHSESLSSLQKFQKAAESTLVSQDKKLTELQSMALEFNKGLVSIQKIEEKLASWSERFRSIEENLYNTNSKLEALENLSRHKRKKMKKNLEQVERSVLAKVKSVLNDEFSEKIEVIQVQLSRLTENFFQFKEEMEKLEESSGLFQKSVEKEESSLETKSKGLNDSVKINANDNSVKQTNVKETVLTENSIYSPDSPRKLLRSNTIIGVNLRLLSLENQIFNISEEMRQKENKKNCFEKIVENKDLTEIKEDVENLLKKTLLKVQLYKVYFDNLSLEENSENFIDAETLEKLYSAELEKISGKGENLKEKLKKLEENCKKLIKEHKIDIDKSIKSIESALIEQKESMKSPELIEGLKELLESQQKSLIKLEDKHEKLKTVTMTHLSRPEIGDILVQFANKLKNPNKDPAMFEDYGPKIFELEQRLNKISRSHNNSLEILQTLEEKISGFEKILVQLQENKSINVEFKISTLESNLSDQIKEVKESFKFFESVPELIPLENERYFRSMLLELRTDMTQIKSDLEKLKQLPSEASIPMSNTSIEEIQEPIQINILQNILKQHENAIRLLANKIIPTSSPEQVIQKISDNEVELSYLEELKREMKEMIQKKEENQRLSKQDLDLIQKISETAEGKIGREELGQKAEKEDLKRIYNLLKKRIDILADALKRSQTVFKEEPFFTKKSMKLECASCGRLTSAEFDKKISENNARMQNRSPTSGIAFSKILSSLIPNSRGGLRLPIKSDRHLEPLSSPKSQKKYLINKK